MAAKIFVYRLFFKHEIKAALERDPAATGPIAVILAPPLIIIALLIFEIISWLNLKLFLRNNWGNVGSAWGLLIATYVLFVAKGAKRAAEDARARQRERTVVEELEEARSKIQQVGLFARNEKWDVVQLRAEEVLGSCRAAIARWGGDPITEEAKNRLISATTIVRSIAELAASSSVRDLNERQRRDIIRAQLEVTELLSTVLGQSRRVQERGRE